MADESRGFLEWWTGNLGGAIDCKIPEVYINAHNAQLTAGKAQVFVLDSLSIAVRVPHSGTAHDVFLPQERKKCLPLV